MDTDKSQKIKLAEKELTEKILGACIEVSRELGSGFLESVYLKALLIALNQIGLKVEEQKKLTVFFRGRVVGEFYSDLLVEDRVIIELKSMKSLTSEHEAQLINYLKAARIKVGLLVNFGRSKLEWKRRVY
jgi:GxxExxY protein